MKLPVLHIPGIRKRRPYTPVPPGSAPGTLVIDSEAPQPVVGIMAYGQDQVLEESDTTPERIREVLGAWPVAWVNVDGLGDATLLEALRAIFGLHQLALEDVLNVRHRPKLETYEDHLFIVSRMPRLNDGIENEQLSVFVGSNWVLTFQERKGDCLDPVRARIRDKRSRFRTHGADYLAYAVIDAVVDSYFPVLEIVGERLEELEERIVASPTKGIITEVQQAKRDMLTLRRAIWPHQEFLGSTVRSTSDILTDDTRLFLRDTYDHAIRIVELVDTYREIASGLTDLYMSAVNNRMSDVMKVLTIIATIFIPLTFVAGIYGMNFDSSASPWNMPELRWVWGYPAALGVMAVIAGALALFFRRKGWIGGDST